MDKFPTSIQLLNYVPAAMIGIGASQSLLPVGTEARLLSSLSLLVIGLLLLVARTRDSRYRWLRLKPVVGVDGMVLMTKADLAKLCSGQDCVLQMDSYGVVLGVLRRKGSFYEKFQEAQADG